MSYIDKVSVGGSTYDIQDARVGATIINASASGDIATFPDGSDSIPVSDCLVQITPVQDLNGQASPYPAGGGKNKFNQSIFDSSADYATWYNNYDYSAPIVLKANTQYTFAPNSTSNVGSGVYYVVRALASDEISEEDTSFYAVYNGSLTTNTTKQFTTGENGKVVFGLPHTNLATNLEKVMSVNWQLEEGSSATSYAPYSNICPITGWTGANVYRTGKNLCGGKQFADELKSRYSSATIDETDKTVSFGYNASATSGVYFPKIPFKENTQYTFIITMKNDTIARSNLRIAYTDGTVSNFPDLHAASTKETWAVTSSSDKTVLSLAIRSSGGTTVLYYDECGTFEGAITASEFEPYHGTTYPISWQTEAGTVYRGTLDVTTGELTVTAICEDMGDFDWTYSDTGTYPYFSSDALPSPARIRSAGVKSVIACERYKPIANMTATNFKAADYNNQICMNSGISTGYKLIVQDSAYSDADLFKTAVTGTKIVTAINPNPGHYLVYQLTPVEILTLLGVNNVWSDTGATSVSYTADTKLYIENLTKPTEDDMTANANIASGVYFMVGNRLFLSTASIAQGEAIVPGTNCTETSLAEALNTINA